jgi:hypothetical protein
MSNQQFDRNNTGVLFKNDRAANERAPQYKGSINIEGTEYWLSSWVKDGAKGKFMSLSVTPKEQQAAPATAPKRDMRPAAAPASSGFDDFDDLPPF